MLSAVLVLTPLLTGQLVDYYPVSSGRAPVYHAQAVRVTFQQPVTAVAPTSPPASCNCPCKDPACICHPKQPVAPAKVTPQAVQTTALPPTIVYSQPAPAAYYVQPETYYAPAYAGGQVCVGGQCYSGGSFQAAPSRGFFRARWRSR